MESVREVKNLFPDDLEGRLSAVLNGVNTELKTVTLLHLDDRFADATEIKARVRKTIGKKRYLPNLTTFEEYLSRTLVPIGMVARQEIVHDTDAVEVIGYALTGGGKRYGVPIAAFTLQWAVDNNTSMHTVLGSTNSATGSRSPQNTIKFLRLLQATDNPLRIEDFRGPLSSSTIALTCRRLKEIGFISYETVGELKKDCVLYQWTGNKRVDEIGIVRKLPTLTRKVAEAFVELGTAGVHEIGRMIQYTHRSNITAIIRGLESQGAIVRDKWKVGVVGSEIRLLENGKKFLETYLTPIEDALSNGATLEDMKRAQIFIDLHCMRAYTQRGIEIYRKISPGINKKPKEETYERIVRDVETFLGSRSKEVSARLDLNRPAVAKYLNELVKQGRLKKVRDSDYKKAVRYYRS